MGFQGRGERKNRTDVGRDKKEATFLESFQTLYWLVGTASEAEYGVGIPNDNGLEVDFTDGWIPSLYRQFLDTRIVSRSIGFTRNKPIPGTTVPWHGDVL